MSQYRLNEWSTFLGYFLFSDTKVNISMKISARKNLEMYLIDNQGNKTNVIKKDDCNGDGCTLSKKIEISASSNVST